jgi:hypothetical protein
MPHRKFLPRTWPHCGNARESRVAAFPITVAVEPSPPFGLSAVRHQVAGCPHGRDGGSLRTRRSRTCGQPSSSSRHKDVFRRAVKTPPPLRKRAGDPRSLAISRVPGIPPRLRKCVLAPPRRRFSTAPPLLVDSCSRSTLFQQQVPLVFLIVDPHQARHSLVHQTFLLHDV